ncbi:MULTISPECIES: hypothetical protein [Streptomyces]|nr:MULTISPECIES: hypothetical protein [Streptomyces]WCL87837.1 hypothetical protein PPN52_26280 [Streptomyces sp. JCM 35825]
MHAAALTGAVILLAAAALAAGALRTEKAGRAGEISPSSSGTSSPSGV